VKYKNKSGVEFEIEHEVADVPADADYFGYLFHVAVTGSKSEPVRIYKALVNKSLCSTEEKARVWLNTTAFDFLCGILETYKDGKTLLLIPPTLKWFVI
jgi:hypothetical protein